MSARLFLLFSLAFTLFNCKQKEGAVPKPPNILFIFIDDMGYGDLGCYGNQEVETPHIDQLAAEGLRVKQFYVNSPICSPSRAAVMTGQYPSRWGITSFINGRKANAKRGMRDYLDLSAPSLARALQQAGYYTAHVGKWHLGGGRDIGEAPLITEYGFNESVTQFEGLGERYLATFETLPNLKDSTRRLEKMSAALGRGPIHWLDRDRFTEVFVDHTLAAIKTASAQDQPFYINLWPDDIHTPLEPPQDLRGDLQTKTRFLGVMKEMDRQLGRLFEYIKNDEDLRANTLIVFTSDNGPDKAVNKAGQLRGYKTNLYEGGIREPFIVWWPQQLPEDKVGTIDEESVIAAIDLAPTFLSLAGVKYEETLYDGKNILEILRGTPAQREAPLYWIRPPDRPGYDGDNDPDLAIRQGDYKLLMDVDQSNIQLYQLSADISESHNLAEQEKDIVAELSAKLAEWYASYPHQIDRLLFEKGLTK